jgi:hypothetical protein
MKNTVILLIILLFLLPFCQGQKEKKNIKVDTLQLYIPLSLLDTNNKKTVPFQLYFPLGIIDNDTTLSNNWRESVYSGDLYRMKEPVIYTDTSHNEIYRFTWLRDSRVLDTPITIRIEKQENKYMLYWKYYGNERHDPGEWITIIAKQKELDEDSWIEFQNLLTQIDFWNMETSNRGSSLYHNGAQWILEGKNSSQYHVVDRWSPSRKNKYYQCCDFLIKLTDLKIRRWNKY